VNVCPTGALSLQNERAFIEESLCTVCEACLEVCPQDAILSVEPVEATMSRQIELADPRPADAVKVAPQTATPSLRDWALPAVGSALLWTGREVLPRLASLALELWDRRTRSPGRVPPEQAGGRGRRHRQRQRGR
jgi:hypothetical protein